MAYKTDVDSKRKVTVVGGGGWGTALAVLLGKEVLQNRKNLEICLWIRREEIVRSVKDGRINRQYLPGVKIPECIEITSSIEEAVNNAELVVIAVPSQYLRSVVKIFVPYLKGEEMICSASKGIEVSTFKRMSEVLHEETRFSGKKIAVLSGPSHAEEAGIGKTTAVVVASKSDVVAKYIQQIFSTPTFRVYTSNDIRGVEYGGSLKNVIAIGAGVCDGLQKINYDGRKVNIGDNAKASLLTRGIEEMARFGIFLGSKRKTFYGLSGWGDLLVTAYSRFGRNRLVGECLASGMTLDEIKEEKLHGMVPEGVETTKAVHNLSKVINVEMPITEQIYLILYEGKDIEEAIYDLMARSLKPEHGYYIRGIPKRIKLALRSRKI